MTRPTTNRARRRGSAADPSTCLLTPQAYDAVSRVDLMTFTERVFAEVERGHPFSPNWHLELLCAELQGVAEGRTRRQIVNVPPRSLKSISASVALVAWMLGHDPTKKVMVVSYGQELADKLARDTRQVMQSRWYKRLFPATRLSAARSAAADFEATQGGGRLATSFCGAITGRGCDLIIIDDPIKPDEALSERSRQAVNDALATTLQSRFNDQGKGAILLLMQRLHEADLSGHLLERGGWKHLNFPAIAEEDETWRIETPSGARTLTRSCGEALHPERLSLEVLDQLRSDMGPYVFAAQYQQRPSPLGGGLITLDMFGRYERSALPAAYDYTLQSWDTANKAGDLNDYSVCTTWGVQGRYAYLLAVDRRKMEYPQLKDRILELRARDRPQFVLIEDGASGSMLLQELQQANLPGVQACKPQSSKEMRLMAVSSIFAAGYVLLPKEAPWLAAYEHEIVNFPKGKHDDQVDSTSQALKWIMERDCRSGLFRFIGEEARRLTSGEAEGPPVRIRSLQHVGQIMDGAVIHHADADGVFLIPAKLARTLLGAMGWASVA